MYRRILVALVLLSTLAGCSGEGRDGAGAEPSPTPSFPFANVLLDNGDESTLLTVEVAETPEQRERGLSEKESLAEDEGMVFVYLEEQDSGFGTRATIPLSLAFFDVRGTIVDIVDAAPCANDPCPAVTPGAPYMGVLAVNDGAFEEWDIAEGDHLQLTR